MAGRKHHFIQQLLLKGFSFDHPKDPCHLWVYHRSGKIYSPATEGYAAERDFYGHPESWDLDDRITESEEPKFNRFLSNLRTEGDQSVAAEMAAAFAIHVFIRSKNLRSMITEGVKPLMACCREKLMATDQLEQFIASALRDNPEAILQKLGAKSGPPSMRAALVKMITPKIPELARAFVAQQRNQIDAMLDSFQTRIEPLVADAHRNTLIRCLDDFSGTRRHQLESLTWQTVSVHEPLILGDSVIFVELMDGSFKPATEPGDVLNKVWIPISSSRVLVGCINDHAPNTTASNINRGSASCSFDAFCSSCGPETFQVLIPLIRTSAFKVDEAAITRIADDCFAKALK